MDLYLMRQDSLEDHDPLKCNTFGLRRLRQGRSIVKLRRSPQVSSFVEALCQEEQGDYRSSRGFFQEQGGRNGPGGFSGASAI